MLTVPGSGPVPGRLMKPGGRCRGLRLSGPRGALGTGVPLQSCGLGTGSGVPWPSAGTVLPGAASGFRSEPNLRARGQHPNRTGHTPPGFRGSQRLPGVTREEHPGLPASSPDL